MLDVLSVVSIITSIFAHRCADPPLLCVGVSAPHPPDLVVTLLHYVGVAGMGGCHYKSGQVTRHTYKSGNKPGDMPGQLTPPVSCTLLLSALRLRRSGRGLERAGEPGAEWLGGAGGRE